MRSDEIQSFYQNGFVILNNIFSQNEVEQLSLNSDQIINNEKYIQQYPSLYDFEKLSDHQDKVVRCVKSPELISEYFQQIAVHPNLLEALTALLGKNMRLERIKMHCKAAYHGSAVNWHQDWAYQPYTNDSVIMVCVHIDDCTKDNAPIHIIPQSHQGPIYSHQRDGCFSGFINANDLSAIQHLATPVLASKGSVSFHHYRTVHYSPSNTSPNRRCILLLRFAAADAWPLMGALDYTEGFNFEDMKSRIVKGEQTLEPRLADIPVRMPLPYPASFN